MRFKLTNKPEDLTPYGEGHVVNHPEIWRGGVVFASPHSGAIYPDSFLKRSKLSPHQLRRNEDVFIDHLFHSTTAAGAPFLKALFPRVFVDVNRAADELPLDWSQAIEPMSTSQPTPRAMAGLGVIPTYLSEKQDIYEKLPSIEDVKARLTTLYQPYHDRLCALLEESSAKFGQVLLVDCHSMPGFAPMGARRPDIILGDRFGTACHPDTLALFKSLFSKLGYSVGVNYPYAGGYTTAHYGKPVDGVEAIQIEVNRDLYVNPVTLTPKSGYSKLQNDLSQIIQEIVDWSSPQVIAAQ